MLMLRFAEDIVSSQVVNLSTGRAVATVSDLLIDPDNLKVAALICYVRSQNAERYLMAQDIHDFSGMSIAVQNDDALSDSQDIVRLQELMKINYKIVGKKVTTDAGRTIGVVSQYVVDDKSLVVEKIYVRPSLIKLLQSSDRVISRTIIVEVTDKEIIVKDTLAKASAKNKLPVSPTQELA